MYALAAPVSISPSLDKTETTAHDPSQAAQDGSREPERQHAYRVFACKKCGQMSPVVALARCGDRTCPDCRKQDFYRLYDAYKPSVASLARHRLKLVTLTLKNRTRLWGAVDDLREAWKKLLRRRPYRDCWRGGLYVIECVNKGNGWHVHLHAMVEGSYIPQRQLVEDWLELTGDSFIVHIEDCPKPIAGLRYILKYLLKAPGCAGEEKEYNLALKGRRLIQAFGAWYGEVTAVRDEMPAMVCQSCGHPEWLVIIRWVEEPLAVYRAYQELLAFFTAARGS